MPLIDAINESEADVAQLRLEIKRLRALVRNLPAFLGTANREMIIDYYNFTPLDGKVLEPEAIVGKHVSKLHWWRDDPENNALFTAATEAALAGKASVLELPNVHADGRPSVSEVHFTPLEDETGRINHALLCGLDVTARVRDREYRSMLLKEVNHRVKNSLQVANSILSLEASSAPDPEVALNYRKAAARIMAISKVHDLIYRIDTFTTIPFGNYLKDLCDELQKTAHDERLNHTIDCRPCDVEVEASRAINLALITNELVTNSFKYAFQTKTNGKVTVTLERSDNNLLLRVEDNGTGTPTEQAEGGTGLGTRLVEMLTREMGGRIESSGDSDGYTTRLAFPLDKLGNR